MYISFVKNEIYQIGQYYSQIANGYWISPQECNIFDNIQPTNQPTNQPTKSKL